jgi:hypothetical protein
MDPHAKSHLNIIYWNADGIRRQINEFYDFLDENFIHVACVNETHLKTNLSLHSHPDYIIYRLDRTDRPKGGVAIFIHRSIKHRQLPHPQTTLFECIGLQILTENGSAINITSAYMPGGSTHASVINQYLADIEKLTSSNISYFICGDFNSKHVFWNCNRANPAGNILYDIFNRRNFLIDFPSKPTRYPDGVHGTPSTIDLVLTNGRHQTSELKTITALNSDHQAVKFKIYLDGSVQRNTERSSPDFKNADWDRYRTLIHFNILPSSLNLESIKEVKDIDDHIEKFTALIKHAQNKAVPMAFHDRYKLNIPDDLKDFIASKNAQRRRWQKYRNPADKTHLNWMEKQIKIEINKIRNENWNAKLADIKPSNNSVWKTSRMIKNRNKTIPALKYDGKILVTSQEKAKIIGEEFFKNHQNPLAENDPEFNEEIQNKVEDFFNNNNEVFECEDLPEEEEIVGIIKKLKNPKAPGQDKINNILLKKLPSRGISYLLFIIIACMKFSYFPEEWKKAKVIPIPKPGKDHSDPSSYRPISLLCSLSKILERVLLNRINKFLNEHQILPPEQHGFKAKFSTTHQLHNLIGKAKEMLREKASTGIIMLDVEKAFDRVWHDGLLSKMIDLNFPGYIIKMVKHFLKDRKFHVEIFGQKSKIFEIPFGVPQGAVLSPTLYNIYTFDIPKFIRTSLALFADDTAFYSSSPSAWNIAKNLRAHAKIIASYMKKWKININNRKTQALFITNRRKHQLPKNTIKVFGEDVKWQTDCKYLGMVLEKKLTFKKHIDYVVNKTNIAIRTLYSMINRKSQLNIKNKLLVYKLAIRPIFTYACPAFIRISKNHIKKLQILQNKTLKMIMDKSRYERTVDIHQEAEVPMVSDYIKKLTDKFNENRQQQ